jgi:hypothetical protein
LVSDYAGGLTGIAGRVALTVVSLLAALKRMVPVIAGTEAYGGSKTIGL